MNFGVLYVLPCSCPLAPVWSSSLWGQGGSSWPQVKPACPLTLSPQSLHPFQLFGWLSWLKTRLKQAKWAQIAHETEPSWRLPDHPDGVGPSHHPSLHCPHHEDDFYLLQYLILTFLARDMLWQRLKMAILVTVATRYGPHVLKNDAKVPNFGADWE